MFGKKKREQEAEEAKRRAEEARKRAEEAEREAQEAEADASALTKKRAFALFRRRKNKAEPQPAPAEEPAPEAAPQPEPQPEPQPAPKETRKQRKERLRQEKEEQRKEERIRDLEIQLHRAERKSKSARFCDLFAFLVLLFAAALMLLGPLLKSVLTEKGLEAMTTASTVAQYCLLAAIALPAWYFVYRKSIGWKIAFVLGLAGFITGSILGFTL